MRVSSHKSLMCNNLCNCLFSVVSTKCPALDAPITLDAWSTDLPPPCRTQVMEQSPLIAENSGYETIQSYR